MHSQLFRPRTQWKDSVAVKINSFPVGGGVVWLCLGTSCTLLSESAGIGHAMGRGNKPGFWTWLTLPPHTENSYPTDHWSCWIPFHGNILRSCWFSGWCSIIFIIFFSAKQFLSVDSIKQTFGLAVNREHTRPTAGSLWFLRVLLTKVCKSGQSNHSI